MTEWAWRGPVGRPPPICNYSVDHGTVNGGAWHVEKVQTLSGVWGRRRICLKRPSRGISRPKARFLASRTSAPTSYSAGPHPWMHGEADDRRWDPAITQVPEAGGPYAGFVLEAESAGSVGRFFSNPRHTAVQYPWICFCPLHVIMG